MHGMDLRLAGSEDPHRGGRSVDYDEAYVRDYARHYLEAWPLKHQINTLILKDLLGRSRGSDSIWLDTCCGQAWHFSRFPDTLHKIGVDRSLAQLRRARLNNPDAALVCADIAHIPLLPCSMSLVTNFWGGYCYLNDWARIQRMFRRLCECVRVDGWLYFEILLPDDIASFNDSEFARATGFRVSPVSEDFSYWEYLDTGGVHRMCSPPLSMFLTVLHEMFHDVGHFHDGSFMTHLIGGRRRVVE